MDKLIEFALTEWPCIVSIIILISMIIFLIGLPLALYWWLRKFIGKDRYMFAQNDHLYCLDTVTGKIKVARGYVFQEVGEWDKVTKAPKEKNADKS